MCVPEVFPVKVVPSRVTVGASRSTRGPANARSECKIQKHRRNHCVEVLFNEELQDYTHHSSSFYTDRADTYTPDHHEASIEDRIIWIGLRLLEGIIDRGQHATTAPSRHSRP